MNISNSLVEKDLSHLIHPYTNLARHQDVGPFVIAGGNGVRVLDDKGKSYIEAMSGLWSCGLGFSEERLVEAAIKQMRALPYYHSFSHKTHAAGVELAARLAELAPGNLNYVHFTNSGSEANDTVVKMIWYMNNALDRPKKKTFIARQQGYHGATVAAGSLTGLPSVHQEFDLPAIPVRHLTCPHFYRFGLPGETEAQFTERLARELEDTILAEGPGTIAAFIGEPLIAAGGVIPAPEGYWARVQEICRRYDIVLVVDEIITGFGRLGRMFGSDYYGITPDILVLSKQLTSSYQPLAAIVVTDEINEVFVAQSSRLGSFVHGFTTTGHPVATAVALENLRIIEEEGLVERARDLGETLQAGLRSFSGHPLVGEVRGTGLIGGIELVADKESRKSFNRKGALGAFIFQRAHHHGLIIRAIHDTTAFCPPLVSTQHDLAAIFDAFQRTLDEATAWAKAEGLN